LMLQRYRQLIEQPYYQVPDDMGFAAPLPSYAFALDISRIVSAHYLNNHQNAELIAHLIKDRQFWRRILHQGGFVLDKMIAVAGLWINTQFSSDLIASGRLSENELAAAEELTSPYTAEEIDIHEAFNTELRALAIYLIPSAQGSRQLIPDWKLFGLDSLPIPLDWLLQPNATLNRYAQKGILPIVCLSQLSAREFDAELHKVDNRDIARQCPDFEQSLRLNYSPSVLYNPAGKFLLAAAMVAPQDYIARMHDLSGMQQLLALHWQIARSGIKPEDWLRQYAPQSPFGEALKLDENSESLRFTCRSPHSVCQIQLRTSL